MKNIIKNAWGFESHPTDSLIHWSEKNPIEAAKKLRAAYNKLVKDEASKRALEYLMQESYLKGKYDEVENNAGENF